MQKVVEEQRAAGDDKEIVAGEPAHPVEDADALHVHGETGVHEVDEWRDADEQQGGKSQLQEQLLCNPAQFDVRAFPVRHEISGNQDKYRVRNDPQRIQPIEQE